MGRYSPLVVALAALCLLSACGGRARRSAVQNSVEAVTAEGYAPYNDGGPAAAAAAALDAQKNAIENVAGLFIQPMGKAERYDLLGRTLLRSPQLYVRKHKVLSERKEGDLYRVTVKAYVYVDKIASAIRGLSSAEPAGPGAAGAVMLDEYAGASASPYGDARAAFTAYLSRKTIIKFLNAPALSGAKDEDSFFEAARAAGADLVFIGRADSSPLSAAQGQQAGFYTARAKVGMKVYAADSRKPLLELSGDSSALDVAEEGAFRKALSSAGELLGQEAVLRSDRFLKPLSPLVLRVRGLKGVPDAVKFKEAVGKMAVGRADFESYSDGEAVMTVYPERSDAQEFASSMLRMEALSLALESASQFEAVFSVIR